ATRNSSACSWLRGNIERAVTRPRMFPNTTPSSSRARARDLSYSVGSHKLTCVVHTALMRSLVVFATRDDGQRIVVTSIVSQFQRAGLRAHEYRSMTCATSGHPVR